MVIRISPELPATLAEAIAVDGFTRFEYFKRMSRKTFWDSLIEICAGAELCEVAIAIYRRNDDGDLMRRYIWTATLSIL